MIESNFLNSCMMEHELALNTKDNNSLWFQYIMHFCCYVIKPLVLCTDCILLTDRLHTLRFLFPPLIPTLIRIREDMLS